MAIEGYFKFERVVSLQNNLFPFPLATALLIGDVMTNRRSGVKLFLSVITAPIVLAHPINFLNRRCHVNSPRLAYSKYKYVRANTIGVVNVHILITQSRWETEQVFLNVYRAQESIPRNEFRQPMSPGGPVR